MVATTGAELLPSQSVEALREHLIAKATVLTPNLPEALLLLNGGTTSGQIHAVGSTDELQTLAVSLKSLGAEWVLLKGGHCPFTKDGKLAETDEEREVVVNVLVGPRGELALFESEYQQTRSTHGTGCSLACELPLFPQPDWPDVLRKTTTQACA